MTVSLWRIATDTPLWFQRAPLWAAPSPALSSAVHAGDHVAYTATAVSLAAW